MSDGQAALKEKGQQDLKPYSPPQSWEWLTLVWAVCSKKSVWVESQNFPIYKGFTSL